MRIAHTCAGCGIDLTRTPAPIDAVYGLPIVVCPECRTAVVRREHPTFEWSRFLWRLVFALAMLGVRVVVTLAITGFVVGMTGVAQRLGLEVLDSGFFGHRESLVIGGVVWLVVTLIAGLWVGLLWAHWRAWQAAAMWLVVLMGMPFVAGAFIFLDYLSSGLAGGFGNASYAWQRTAQSSPDGFWLLPISWVVSLCTLPIGRRAGAIWQKASRRWRWSRARATRKSRCTSKLLLRA